MKKWILLFLGVLLAGAILINVFIPSTLTITRTVPARCRAVAAFPVLSDEGRWKAWWPDSAERADFHIRRLSYQTIDIGIREGDALLDSRMSLLPVGNQDSSLLNWETRLICGWSPLDRWMQWQRARRLGETMEGILLQASDFLGKKENLYGIPIGEGSTKDTLLISTRTVKPGYPSNADVYEQIGKLSSYARESKTEQTGYPMVNITAKEDQPGAYQLMVAMPVGARLQDRGDIHFSRLIPGRYLITEVRGGPAAVAGALAGLKEYIRDYQRTVMAIPFQLFVTDRMQEPDSSRWVTKIYYPVF